MNLVPKILHFTIGPVQGFVAQARRTRDLWSGSFLLSYLAGQAMYTVIKGGGRIVFPSVQDRNGEPSDRLLKSIEAYEKGFEINDGPIIGTLPNRFKAEVPDNFDPVDCEKAVRDAWKRIVQAVWDRYVADVAGQGNGTKLIWDRQIENFWDMAWVVCDTFESDNMLDCRKNWRSYVPQVEPGDKCTIMGNQQELSGYYSSKNAGMREKQTIFWSAIRGRVSGLDLRDDERLCAISLVKRLFPRVSPQAIGWEVPINYPSTVYLSAVHWMEKMLEQKSEMIEEFVEVIETGELYKNAQSEYKTRINCLTKLAESKEAQKFINLDGNFLHKATLSNEHLWPENSKEQRDRLLGVLKKFKEYSEHFYSVLLMDGDNLGALLQDYDGEKISAALARFSEKVNKIVQDNNGILIYVGGDDVLTLLPLQDALEAAIKLRNAYSKAFQGSGIPGDRATISAGIVYAHHHAPIKSVLKEAHRLLDEVAKEKTGRDSLAINVWKTAGPVLCWSAPWKVITSDSTNLLAELVAVFKGTANGNKQFNSSFFYNIRNRFAILAGNDHFSNEDNEIELLTSEFFSKDENMVELLTAEYFKNRERRGESVSGNKVGVGEAKRRIEKLIKVCRDYKRTTESKVEIKTGAFNVNGALLVRFLAEKEVSK